MRRPLLLITAVALLCPAASDAAYLSKAHAENAVLEAMGPPFPGGVVYIRRCDRLRATVLKCRFTIDQREPFQGVTWVYNGIAWVRIKHGEVLVRDPDTVGYPTRPTQEPISAW